MLTAYAEHKTQQPYSKTADIIEHGREYIFDFDYPLFDDDYRVVLETKILKHFYMDEIAFETPALFKFKLDDKLNLIMPYYNKLYESELLNFNPLENVDMTTTYHNDGTGQAESTGNVNSENHSESDNTDKNRNIFSNTPQGQVAPTSFDEAPYQTNNTLIYDESNTNVDSNGNTDSSSNSNTETHNEGEQHVIGKTPGETYSEMLQKYRDTFLNIDLEIIHQLETLFMGGNRWPN